MSDTASTGLHDQTNGLAGNLEGESDGTSAGDLESAADQTHVAEPRPVGAQDTFRSDWYGESDGVDLNP